MFQVQRACVNKRSRPRYATGAMANPDDGSDGSDLARRARALLQGQRQGVLSTISLHRAGYPYGSLTPYALSRGGAPLILISALAAHTQNLIADPRASL